MSNQPQFHWSVVVYDHRNGESEILPEIHRSKTNAQSAAESYLLGKIFTLDGEERFKLRAGGEPIFSTTKYLQSIAEAEHISSFNAHFVIGRGSVNWGLVLTNLKIFTTPVFTSSVITEDQEIEEDEEYEERNQVKIVIPGRIYNSYETRDVVTTKTRKVKKTIQVEKTIETVSFQRHTSTTPLLTVSVAKRMVIESPLSLLSGGRSEQQSEVWANLRKVAIEFADSKSCQALALREYKVSELKRDYPEEFGAWVRPIAPIRRETTSWTTTLDDYATATPVSPRPSSAPIKIGISMATLGMQVAAIASRRKIKAE
jgi:hypothetical protein